MSKLYTGKGDGGTTTLFKCNQRLSKSSKIAEALGALDETNSFLSLCKCISEKESFKLGKKKVKDIIHFVQKDLFIIQAELAGADKKINKSKVTRMEKIIEEIEKELPPINSFSIPGAGELSAYFDFARTVARRAERRAVSAHEEGLQKLGKNSLAYLNRLSSLLYGLARYANVFKGIKEESPDYK